jgi:hypothetical protein
MVGISFHNVDNQQDRQIWLSFRRRDQISRGDLWSVFDKVPQSNVGYLALDALTFHVHLVKIPVGFAKAETSKGRSTSMMAHLERSIVQVNAEENSLAYALLMLSLTWRTILIKRPTAGAKEDFVQVQRVIACVGRRS